MGIKAIGNFALNFAKTAVTAPAVLCDKAFGKENGKVVRLAAMSSMLALAAIAGTAAAFATAMMIVPGFAALVGPATGLLASLAAKVGVTVTPMLVSAVAGTTAFVAAIVGAWFIPSAFTTKPAGAGAGTGAAGAAGGAGA